MAPRLTDRRTRGMFVLGIVIGGALLVLDTSFAVTVAAGLLGASCAGLLALANTLSIQDKQLVEDGGGGRD